MAMSVPLSYDRCPISRKTEALQTDTIRGNIRFRK
jgi:hypothetical protein